MCKGSPRGIVRSLGSSTFPGVTWLTDWMFLISSVFCIGVSRLSLFTRCSDVPDSDVFSSRHTRTECTDVSSRTRWSEADPWRSSHSVSVYLPHLWHRVHHALAVSWRRESHTDPLLLKTSSVCSFSLWFFFPRLFIFGIRERKEQKEREEMNYSKSSLKMKKDDAWRKIGNEGMRMDENTVVFFPFFLIFLLQSLWHWNSQNLRDFFQNSKCSPVRDLTQNHGDVSFLNTCWILQEFTGRKNSENL